MKLLVRHAAHIFALMILTMAIVVSAPAQLNSRIQANAKAGIGKTLSAFEKAWNVHDAHAFASYFAEDADFTNVFGQSAKGRSEIEKFHAPIFSTFFKNSNLKTTDPRNTVRLLKPDLAAVDVFWSMTGVSDPSGKLTTERKGLLNAIMMPEKGKWVIKVMHNMDLAEPPH